MGLRSSLFAFIGVSTKHSAVNDMFPKWIKALGVECDLVGFDLEVGAKPSSYSELLDRLSGQEWVGGLVTTHKAHVFQYAGDRISSLTPRANLLEEVCALYKDNSGALCGDATDPDAVLPILAKLLRDRRWKNGSSEVLIMGGGGAGLALLYSLIANNVDASSIAVTESNSQRIAYLVTKSREIQDLFRSSVPVAIHGAGSSEAIVQSMRPGCLIVNATGMGKDIPGSPINNFSAIPNDSIIWEFNYRGGLDFLVGCNQVASHKNLLVEAGWYYFICGWANVMSAVFKRPLTETLLNEFEKIAADSFVERQGFQ